MFSVCYIDEAGCTGVLPTATSDIQPAFIVTALIVDEEKLKELTRKFIALKIKFFPTNFDGLNHHLDALMTEIKGCEIRRELRGINKGKIQHHFKFIDGLFDLLDELRIPMIARIWVKGIGVPFNGRSVYTVTTQRIAKLFDNYLDTHGRRGVMIADFRDPNRNSHISHCVFTQKHRHEPRGDAFPCLVEIPTFGISNNHAPLQIADIITSAVLFPAATYVYCRGHVRNVHVNFRYAKILERYRKRLKRRQHVASIRGAREFGITVNDPFERRSARLIL